MRAIIVADGEHAPADARFLDGADLLIAADGGANWLDGLGLVPDRVVGDLDSAEASVVGRLAAANVTIERHPADKDASDLELSLAAATGEGADELVLLGVLGGAVDHLLANVLLLGSDRLAGRSVRIMCGSTVVRLVDGPAHVDLAGPVGSRVSLLPLGSAVDGVTTAGLRWPLEDDRLEAGSSRGLANLVDVHPASVWARAGRLLVIEVGAADGGQDR